MAQWLEERRNHEGRDHDGNSVILVEHALKQGLQRKNEAKVEQSQDHGQVAIHQRAIDNDVNVVEPVAQQCDPDGEGDEAVQERCNQFDG